MFYPEFHLLHLVQYPESLSITCQLYLVYTYKLYILLYLSLLPNLTYTAHSIVYGILLQLGTHLCGVCELMLSILC